MHKSQRGIGSRWKWGRGLQGAGLMFLLLVPIFLILLFIGYQAAERVRIGELTSSELVAFVLVVVLAAAVLTACSLTLVFSRRDQGPSSGAVLPPAATSWKRKLQHVPLRHKIVVPMVMLAMAPATLFGVFTISSIRETLKQRAVRGLSFEAASKARKMEEFLQSVRQDLLFLSRSEGVRSLVASAKTQQGVIELPTREEIEREFLLFSFGKEAYYQLRYLDDRGRELIRLNVEHGRPIAVPPEQLQNKNDRYYVRAALALGSDQVYVSPLDLNIERGRPELPLRTVVRYATAIPGPKGKSGGILVINVRAEYLLRLIQPLAPGTEAWLVDSAGAYLVFVGDSEERRNHYRFEQRRRLSEDYSPELTSAILVDGKGSGAFETGRRFVSYGRIFHRGQASSPRHWILLIARARTPILAPIRQLTTFLSVVLLLVVAVSGIFGVLVAHYVVRPVASLRRATHEIAAGNLSKQVVVTTGDEIEGLANDFNAMTIQLREAHEQLSQWNEELEREVARQTDHLHKLQSGLARADKLASIGQMTASIMHEIGNPLAAIKTRIQVAEEEGESVEQRMLLNQQILEEVDRLSGFLRSFSRLSRLREPELNEVFLSEVVQSVATLISPELDRKGVNLRLEVPEGLPSISGDANQLRQLLINLILNASQASQAGAEILVRVAEVLPAGNDTESGRCPDLCIEVIDRGTGMSPDTLDRIWEPFFTTKSDGTGLGLAICRRIARDHGGTIQVASESGVGTTVTLVFPATESES